jgi:hypothetical protein
MQRDRFGIQWFFGEEGAGGSGGGTSGNGDGGGDKERQNLQKLLDRKNGDAIAVAQMLLGENADHRADKRELNEKLQNLQKDYDELKGKVPGDDVVVLSKADADAFESYKTHGTPDEFKAVKEKVVTLETQNSEIQRETLLRDVASETGFKLSVLKDRDKNTPGLSYEIKDVEENGQKFKKAFVKFKDGEGENAPIKEEALDVFAESKWADFIPALKAEHGGQSSNGARHIQQGSGGAGAGGTIFDKIRKDAEANKVDAQGPTLETRLNMPGATK